VLGTGIGGTGAATVARPASAGLRPPGKQSTPIERIVEFLKISLTLLCDTRNEQQSEGFPRGEPPCHLRSSMSRLRFHRSKPSYVGLTQQNAKRSSTCPATRSRSVWPGHIDIPNPPPATRTLARRADAREDSGVLIVCATKKLLARLGSPTLQDGEHSTTLLGQWYATALPWRPQVALLVNEPTLLPVLMPLAPAATLLARIPGRSPPSWPPTASHSQSSTTSCRACASTA